MSRFDLDMDFVRSLAELLKETNLSEIEYAEGDRRIRIGAQTTVQVAAPSAAPAPIAAAPQAPAAAGAAATLSGTPVTSPMVGTVYLAPEPGAPAFIRTGDKVRQGDTLLIIEAMKVMNPIKAPKDGVIADILVGDAAPVEFGDVLIVIA